MYSLAIPTENFNLSQFISSIWDFLVSSHNHIQEFFDKLQDYFSLLSNAKTVLQNTLTSYFNYNNTRAVNPLLIAIIALFLLGAAFIVIDLIRDLL